nr:Gag-Pol polyprotein [Tanacetum cinerariifolium]
MMDFAMYSSHNIGNSNVPTFNQPQVSEYRWTKDHPLEQVCRNPSRPVQTRRQLATDLEMYADHAGCIDSGKSTSRGIQFLGDKLVSWMSKKQNCTAMSSA